MNATEIKSKLLSQSYIEPEMVEATFDFWFQDSDHIRSPFPEYIQENLKLAATDKFIDWSQQISEKAKKDINEEILAEKFEEIIFELGHNMVQSDDEKLTIRYPFMLRLGDIIKVKDLPEETAESKVIERKYEKRADHAYMKVKLKNISSGDEWETEFELPE